MSFYVENNLEDSDDSEATSEYEEQKLIEFEALKVRRRISIKSLSERMSKLVLVL